jgi:hypothetical protein
MHSGSHRRRAEGGISGLESVVRGSAPVMQLAQIVEVE